jgi:hypothetical protein
MAVIVFAMVVVLEQEEEVVEYPFGGASWLNRRASDFKQLRIAPEAACLRHPTF